MSDNPMSLDDLCEDVLYTIGSFCKFNLFNLRLSSKTGLMLSQSYWNLYLLYKNIQRRYSNRILMEKIGLINYTKRYDWKKEFNNLFNQIKNNQILLDLESDWNVAYITQFRTKVILTEKSIIEKLIFEHVF
tara:strand:+ start:1971 stop:2366 length:396 start_codon:yes stop_codon:yes gene_type:complete